jgi:hypothetical protein
VRRACHGGDVMSCVCLGSLAGACVLLVVVLMAISRLLSCCPPINPPTHAAESLPLLPALESLNCAMSDMGDQGLASLVCGAWVLV